MEDVDHMLSQQKTSRISKEDLVKKINQEFNPNGENYSNYATAVYEDETTEQLKPKRRSGKRGGRLIQVAEDPLPTATPADGKCC